MSCTAATFQPLKSASNDEARRNMLRMLCTAETSHAEMSSENASAPGKLVVHAVPAQNRPFMLVTPDTSHVAMWPYIACAAPGSASHVLTAKEMSLSVAKEMSVSVGANASGKHGRPSTEPTNPGAQLGYTVQSP